MSEKQQINPFPVRLEPELSQWVKARAKAGDRSMNAELNRLIKQAREAEQKQTEVTNP
ncbi:Arc family DNA-binding protein [Thiothrix winogradskyi]|uniref:Arc family DNA-binding protein n=1 Tax=Thiothrix winogradskyi TaxID=96472 RepID=A0ABY3T0S3_9GAMM|nr:Arc family DNA-binding protein [Thiothrix winogradskyi]UJS24794.1 Arc family DNA-binding protein [Thiothrix winogradskyi]